MSVIPSMVFAIKGSSGGLEPPVKPAMPNSMKVTVFALLAICGLVTASSSTTTTEKPKSKRGLQIFKSPLSTDGDLYANDFDRNLFPSSRTFPLKVIYKYAPPNLGIQNPGYVYQKPYPQFYEEPVPNFIDILIQPAIQPRAQTNLGEEEALRSNLFASIRQRRLITPVNEDLFFKFPGYVSEEGLRVRVPVGEAKPTRIVVPQHQSIALGSGGLGYSMLPGGRIALGSGSRGISNLVRARNNPLPPLPPTPARGPLSQPQYYRREDSANDEIPSSNSLTVFPQSAQDLLFNWQN